VARFRPFRGIRFSGDKTDGFDRVVAPPYDVISPERRDELYESSPFNVTRLILNPAGHAEAARLWRAWQSQGALRRDDEPVFYLYRQDFECDGPKSRVGILGALYLEPFATGVVRPHERTFAHHKRDRLELTKQVEANLSPIFGLYSNRDFDPTPDGGWDAKADVDVVHEGVRNRLRVVRDAAHVAAISDAVAGRTVFIADGHHRYETALNYWNETHSDQPLAPDGGPDDEREPAAHVMAFLGRFEDPGMLILPTHRELVSSGGADLAAFAKELERRFEVRRFPRTREGRAKLLASLSETPHERNAFGLALRAQTDYLLLRARPGASVAETFVSGLDVSVLHSIVLGEALTAAGAHELKLEYSHVVDRVLDRADDGVTEGAFLMRPMLADDMARACMAGELLPQKSTYFYPKLLTGLVFHTLAR
jgi:uncharacterized protein (DUF1015 family)